MKKINYKSDFDFYLDLKTCNGDDVGWPSFDWEAILYTSSRANSVKVGVKGGTPCGCFNDGGRIHVAMNNHRLQPGILKAEIRVYFPNGIYPDGDRLLVTPESLDIELVNGSGDSCTPAEIDALMPYIKGERGDAFTYDDFTAEELAELQRPATEAAERADALAGTLAANELIRVKAESERELAETRREEAENLSGENELLRNGSEVLRDESESARKAAELGRETAETARVEAEVARQMAESARQEEFTSYGEVLDDKVGKAELAESLLSKQDKLTVSEDLELSDNKLSLADIAKMRLFCDMFNEAAGEFGYAQIVDGQFDCVLNGLELTYEEAMEIYNLSAKFTKSILPTLEGVFNRTRVRTLLPLRCGGGVNGTSYGNLYATFQSCPNIEIIQFGEGAISCGSRNNYSAFRNCPKLREIRGRIDFFSDNQSFYNTPNLEEIRLHYLANSQNFRDQPKLSLASFQYMVKNRSTSTNINAILTITVHADVYAKLTGDTSNEAAAALSAEELAAWQKVCTDAAAKNISFASA